MQLPRSLQGRLLTLVLGLVVVVWMLTAVATWFDARHELDELLDSHLAQAAALLVAQQSHEAAEMEQEIDTPTLHRYAPKVAFQVFHEGHLVLRSANAPALPMVANEGRTDPGFHTVRFDGSEWRVFSTVGAEGDVQVFVGEQSTSRTSILWAVLRSTLWPMLLALPLLAFTVWWAVRLGVEPLRQLGRSLAERDPHALALVAVPGAPTEMAPMLDALNALFARIVALMESERRFTADAAHELRTPIAAIRAQAQVALGESGEEQRRHALQATLEGCDRATRLVAQLLTLSRLEAGAQGSAAEVDLGSLVKRVVADEAPQGLRKDQTIEVDALAPCRVSGEATLLAVLVRNLVDNALRYSPPQATVKVAVTNGPDGPQLRVEDSGPGLPQADMARLGERFFRVLGSGEGGSGLGWSIIRRIAAAHRATVRVSHSSTLGGLCVDVVWPRN
ncbi:ATP-binding protein [soil metagenome]